MDMIGATSRRDSWTVVMMGEQLGVAARKKKAHHILRLDWWKKKKEEVIAEIRSSGLEVTESIVDELGKAGYANTVAAASMRYANQPVVQIDAGMQAHMREAVAKVHEHEDKVKDYDSWDQMLSTEPAASSRFELTHEDWMFFFGQ